MKKILTILLVGVGTLAIAQKKNNPSRSIDDDGKTLSIRVTGTTNGKIAQPCPPKPCSAAAAVFYSDENESQLVSVEREYQPSKSSAEIKEFVKQVKVNADAGEMYLRYSFIRNNEEFIFEKTADISGKSEAQRQRIVDNFESEIELPGKGIEM
ncbi:hypothetical protein [Dyadobacter arcticus]|uniref:DUF4476 domain-containing protein n=1 Tax=Dyadobacter arcticus TaxID=1078754 RepID=A0ABX0UFX0_9BACT|nr:hypothetical protein [Dyadobacter arcticus]NIJ51807.1 hypothetical protein [Dyadobacter arcticus]